jgi:hypothetical protein
MAAKNTSAVSITPELSRELAERIEKNELLARDLESQARVLEARIRLAAAKSNFRKRASALPDEEEE